MSNGVPGINVLLRPYPIHDKSNGSGPAAILTDVSEVSTDICYMIAENKNWIHFMYNFNDLI